MEWIERTIARLTYLLLSFPYVDELEFIVCEAAFSESEAHAVSVGAAVRTVEGECWCHFRACGTYIQQSGCEVEAAACEEGHECYEKWDLEARAGCYI